MSFQDPAHGQFFAIFKSLKINHNHLETTRLLHTSVWDIKVANWAGKGDIARKSDFRI